MNNKQTILRGAVDARKFNFGITQHLPLAMQQQRQDQLEIAKTSHSKGKKNK